MPYTDFGGLPRDGSRGRSLGAKHKLKAFLLQLGSKVEDVSLAVLQKYLETKIIHGL
jgi:hypothetical protein